MTTSTSTLSLFQSILLSTDGTVTDLVQQISGEQIHVTKLSQDIVSDCPPYALDLDQHCELLRRRILLSGSSKHYLYAESFFVINRMSDHMRTQLLESETPIGLLWQQEKLETFREVLEKGRETNQSLLEYFPDAEAAQFLSRSYRVLNGGSPLAVITEKFPSNYFR